MKKILIICLIALGVLFISCKKEQNENSNISVNTDTISAISEKFIGNYSVYCNSVAYGNPLIDVDSLLTISKISDTEVLIEGYFNTSGIITDTNYICIESMSYTGSNTSASMDFTIGVLEGNVLSFRAIGHYTYGWNGPGGMITGETKLHDFVAYKN